MSNWVSVKSSRSSTAPTRSRFGNVLGAFLDQDRRVVEIGGRRRQFPLGRVRQADARLVSSMCSNICVMSSETIPSSGVRIPFLIHVPIMAEFPRMARIHAGGSGLGGSVSWGPAQIMSYDGAHATGLDAVGDPGALHVRQLPVLPAGRNHRFHLAPSPTLATLPVSVLILGLAASVVPAGALIRRFGRRAVFTGSALLAAIGCVAAGAAITPGTSPSAPRPSCSAATTRS